eukprot:TRINITY_DN7315_c0_g1_i1.p1 TRINITY_DN7315_c0_g1~~TRINITY_DN7315_c0_g1_i1.p1  ORF type:complete len:183 (+),score=39.49 TRINITY_DN7315_c0_g1_i1:117-665(+)
MQTVFMLCLLATAMAQEALLAVSKDVVNTYAVAERDIIVRYSIFNLGDETAKEVTLVDESFDEPNSGFTRISGLTTVTFAEIAPGTNVSHHLVVQSSYPGYYNLSAAKVHYYSTEDASIQTVAHSSQPKQVPILPQDDFARAYDTHILDWVVFLALAVALVYVPFNAYKASTEKYAKVAKSK